MHPLVASILAVVFTGALLLPWCIRTALVSSRLQPLRSSSALGIEGRERQPLAPIELISATAVVMLLLCVGAQAGGTTRIGCLVGASLMLWLLYQLGVVAQRKPERDASG
jgi:hypothetical protein